MQKRKFLFWLGFFIILAISLFFRFYKIKDLPGGLHPDVAANGLDAWDILNGKLAVFFPRGNGREGLLFYLVALCIKIFGLKPWAIYLPSAIVSFFVPLLLYLLLCRWFSLKVAFLGSFFLATSYWATVLGRSGFRANLIPLFVVLFLYLLTLAWQEDNKRKLYAFLAGAALGLGFYSYIAYRILAFLIPLLWFLLLYLCSDKSLKAKFILLAKWCFLGVIITVFPLLVFFIQYPYWIVGRSAQVSIFNPDLNGGNLFGFFIEVVGRTLLGYIYQGDLNFRHNVSSFPFVSPLVVPWFILGAAICIFLGFKFLKEILKNSLKYLPYFLSIVFFVSFLIPEITTGEGIPHGLRLIGTMPFTYIFIGLGLGKVWEFLSFKKLGAVIVFFPLGVLIFDFWAYFEFCAKNPDYFYAFRRDLVNVASFLKENKGANLVLEEYSQQSVDCLLLDKGKIYNSLDVYSIKNKFYCPKREVIFTMSTFKDEEEFKNRCPNFKIIREDINPYSKEVLIRVYAPEG